jgi:hypothetical protein
MPLQWKQKLRAVGGIAKLCQRRNKAGHRAGGRPGQFAPAHAGMNRGIVVPSRARKHVLRTRGDEPSFRKIQRIVLADGREADQMTPTHATKRGYSGDWGNQKYETTLGEFVEVLTSGITRARPLVERYGTGNDRRI